MTARLRSARCSPCSWPSPRRAAGATPPSRPPATASTPPNGSSRGLRWREVGPYRGGRSAAVDRHPGRPATPTTSAAPAAACGRRPTAARTWKNVSDGFFGGSIGAVAVSESDPNVVYVGGGEKTVRGNVSHGDGVWKSTDAGKTWKHVGLGDSRHIPRIRIHPSNPDLVYAAVLGHLFGPNDDARRLPLEGRRRDLGAGPLRQPRTPGAVDLALDPANPRVLYASTWRVRRTPYSLESGGPGSGLWKSTDGGDTWTELTGNEGLPKGTLGIIGVAVSPTNPENLYAIVEAEEGGVFRSRDGGETWAKTNDDRALRQRAWYYTRIYADPGGRGGRLRRQRPVPPLQGRRQDLLRDPHAARRQPRPVDRARRPAADDRGQRRRRQRLDRRRRAPGPAQDNQPTAQFYRVSTDTAFPYRILGAQQDNSARAHPPPRRPGRASASDDWEPTAGGESGHIVADPHNPDVVYGGSYGGFLTRVDHRTGEIRDVNAWPDNPMGWGAAELKYRFQWNFPIFFSPHDAAHALRRGATSCSRPRTRGGAGRRSPPT